MTIVTGCVTFKDLLAKGANPGSIPLVMDFFRNAEDFAAADINSDGIMTAEELKTYLMSF